MNQKTGLPKPLVQDTDDALTKNWQKIREASNLDLLIGMPHWDFEFQHFPHRQTIEVASSLLDDLGFDLLCGTHPHTLQPLQKMKGGICMYSLGNFCGIGPAWSVKIIPILTVNIDTDPSDNKVKIQSYEMSFFSQRKESGNTYIANLNSLPIACRLKVDSRIGKIFRT